MSWTLTKQVGELRIWQTPDIDHGLWDDENGFLKYNLPFLEFGFDEEESVNEYVNRIMQLIATDTEFRLGIHN